MKAYGGRVRCIDPYFLDNGTRWRWVVSFTPLPFYPRVKNCGTHWIWRWVDHRVGLDDVERRKFLIPPGLELWPFCRPARTQSLYRLSYPGSPRMQYSRIFRNKRERERERSKRKLQATSQKTYCFSITETSGLMLFSEKVTVLWETYGMDKYIVSAD
jgi:hypothetical protein